MTEAEKRLIKAALALDERLDQTAEEFGDACAAVRAERKPTEPTGLVNEPLKANFRQMWDKLAAEAFQNYDNE